MHASVVAISSCICACLCLCVRCCLFVCSCLRVACCCLCRRFAGAFAFAIAACICFLFFLCLSSIVVCLCVYLCLLPLRPLNKTQGQRQSSNRPPHHLTSDPALRRLMEVCSIYLISPGNTLRLQSRGFFRCRTHRAAATACSHKAPVLFRPNEHAAAAVLWPFPPWDAQGCNHSVFPTKHIYSILFCKTFFYENKLWPEPCAF